MGFCIYFGLVYISMYSSVSMLSERIYATFS